MGSTYSNDEYNAVEELAAWALTVMGEVPHPSDLVVRLGSDDPPSLAHVSGFTAWYRSWTEARCVTHGFVSHTTMNAVDDAFLELP